MYDVDRVVDEGEALMAHGARVWPIAVAVPLACELMYGIVSPAQGRWLRGTALVLVSVGRTKARQMRLTPRSEPIPTSKSHLARVGVDAAQYLTA